MYSLTGKYVKNGSIVGYRLKDTETEEVKMYKDIDTHELARRGQINNCESISNKGKIYLYSTGVKIKDTDNIKSESRVFEVIGRLVSSGKLAGYRVKSNDGKEYNLRKEVVWGLALEGCCVGVEAKLIKGAKVLRFDSGINLDNQEV